jgi:ribosomal protein RSM22 (predicted rRNA methylase)
MGSSIHLHVSDILKEVIEIKPKSILDVGIGFGKWGFLFREYLEIWQLRTYPNQWKIIIDGVEIWKKYIQEYSWLKTFYNNIFNENIYDIMNHLNNYDIIYLGDVLEHLPKEQGLIVLNKLWQKTNKKLIVALPLGNWLNNVIDDNIYDKHLAIWEINELSNTPTIANNIYKYDTGRDYGVFVYVK